MSVKTILVAHREAAVRDRFASALAEARHASVTADTATALRSAAANRAAPVDLALVDLSLAESPLDLVADVRRGGRRLIPVVVFAGSVSSAEDVQALTALGVTAYINEYATSGQILPALAPHLFPDNFNRRAAARVPVAVPLSYQTGASIAGARTQDIGRGGVAIRTMDPLPLGTQIELTFRLPGSARDITAAGRVAWSDRRVGMGVQFEKITSEAQQFLNAFMDEK
ncbi:MAG TPA: TIGR02266 family protein [Vicinamibacterales bacterium]|nr:TIGR02266 family protein [Vicinamibacterales bacterium]